MDDYIDLLKEDIAYVRNREKSIRVANCDNDSLDFLSIPSSGISFNNFRSKVREVLDCTPLTSSVGFFNQLFGGRDSASFYGDTLSSFMNNSLYTRKVSGIHVDIEKVLIEKMCSVVGFTRGEGVFNPGGSISNMVAMVLARNSKCSDIRENGSSSAFTIYTSADGHYSIKKNAGIIGIGRSSVREIPVDNNGAMDVKILLKRICQDEAAGFVPIMINATAGTTIRGAFDPFSEIAEIARKKSIWMHVDGAFGGSLLLCSHFKHLFNGVNQADSMTWDAHKLMNVPLTCSVLLTKCRGLLLSNFNENADYLYQSDSIDPEPGMLSIQCGRRNDSFKLWCSWQMRGSSGYEDKFSYLLSLRNHAITIINTSSQMVLVCKPISLTLCFIVKGIDSVSICRLLEERGESLIGYGRISGVDALRLVFVNDSITFSDIDRFFDNVLLTATSLKQF